MALSEAALLAALILAAAVLYSSVGHAGASGYLAAMALFGLTPEVMRPTALVLNILVATIATARFYRAGFFSWPKLWPFALASVPLAFVGGAVHLPTSLYKPLVGLVLLYAAARLIQSSFGKADWPSTRARTLPLIPAVASGAVIGLLSCLTGVGGGIFLSPLLLFTGWAETRETSGVSAAFILVNSVAGLGGNLVSLRFLPDMVSLWAAAAVLGGIAGSELGSRRLASTTLRRLLALVLVVAGLKLMFT